MAARLIAIMGSGETSPTMRGVHRRLIDNVDGPAILLDTPFGFQLNADELTAKAIEYFRTSVQRDIGVASIRGARAQPLDVENALQRLDAAGYVFAGPGSPTYALDVWGRTAVPRLLEKKVTSGGCITFASAAALTLGALTVPVYEIYKVGANVRWVEGLDLLSHAGLEVAVVPHYNNREGGTHDTRYCYLGEPRLRSLESQLPDDAFIIGIDEHTACVIDLEGDRLSVEGLGDVIVRRKGSEERLGPGETVPLEDIRVHGLRPDSAPALPFDGRSASKGDTTPFSTESDALLRRFDASLDAEDWQPALDALLQLDAMMWDWSTETFGTDEMVRARIEFRDRLAKLAQKRPRRLLAPLVQAVIDARARARGEGRYEEADALRDVLIAAGVEVRDGTSETDWSLRDEK